MALEIKNLSKKFIYDNQEQLLFENLDIVFPERGMVGIVGQSGCGKSTLLNIIGGLDQEYTGSIEIDHKNIQDFCNQEYQKEYISFVYQNYRLFEFMDVYHNCLFYCYLKGIRYDEDELNHLLNIFELDQYQKTKVSQLSGGQKQKVALIRALLCHCPIILCDEPTGALNIENKEKVFQLLKKYSQKYLIIIVTHDQQMKQYTHHIIDFSHLDYQYHFEQKKYAKYHLQKRWTHHSMFRYIFFTLFHQKKKLLMIAVSQIFMMIASSLLITGLYGFNTHYQQQYATTLNNNLITIVKKDQKSFDQKELEKLNGIYGYLFELGQIQEYQGTYQTSLYPYQLNSQEIVVNQAFYKAGMKKNQKIHYQFNNKKYVFKIVKIIKDNYDFPIIYYHQNSIPQQIQSQIKDNSTCYVYINDYQKVDSYIKKLDNNYHAICFVKEEYDGYQQIVQLFKVVATVFIFISLITSVILMLLIMLAIFYEERQNYAVFLANGFSMRRLKNFIFQEVFLISFFNAMISLILLFISVHITNYFDLSKIFFKISKMFVYPICFYNQNDLYVLYFITYIIVGMIVYLFMKKEILKLDVIELLKEE